MGQLRGALHDIGLLVGFLSSFTRQFRGHGSQVPAQMETTRWWGYTPVITVLMETQGGGVHTGDLCADGDTRVHTGDDCANGDTKWWGDTGDDCAAVSDVLVNTIGLHTKN